MVRVPGFWGLGFSLGFLRGVCRHGAGVFMFGV